MVYYLHGEVTVLGTIPGQSLKYVRISCSMKKINVRTRYKLLRYYDIVDQNFYFTSRFICQNKYFKVINIVNQKRNKKKETNEQTNKQTKTAKKMGCYRAFFLRLASMYNGDGGKNSLVLSNVC